MTESARQKLRTILQLLERRFGHVKRHEFLPPPTSADMDAALAVATRNSEIVAAAVLGLHGPAEEGMEAARRLMTHYVDWNEIRVANRESLARGMGRDPRAAERSALLQRFLEAFFLRQRNMNLECLVGMKPSERKQFLADLEVFTREELAALLLTCFGHEVFPPAEPVHRVAVRCGLLRASVTVLQMSKVFEDSLEADQLLELYSHLYAVAWKTCHVEAPDCTHCPLKPRCPAARTFARNSKR
jgi:endonuclease III